MKKRIFGGLLAIAIVTIAGFNQQMNMELENNL